MKYFFRFIFAFCRFFGFKKAMFCFYNVDEAEKQFFDIFLNRKYEIDLQNPEVIVDIGSNIGVSLLYFKEKYGCAKYVGIEPNPEVFRVLVKNCASFCKLYNLAVKDLEFKTFIYSTKDSLTGSLSPNGSISYMTDVVSASTILKDYDRIDLVKISTNGSEVSILRDLFGNNLFSRIKNVIVETDCDNYTEIFNYLANYRHEIKKFDKFDKSNKKTIIYAIQR